MKKHHHTNNHPIHHPIPHVHGTIPHSHSHNSHPLHSHDLHSHTHIEPQNCAVTHHHDNHHLSHSLDLVTTLRSELAASTYKRDRLLNELSEIKSSFCVKESECEGLRAQTARQTTLIGSLQSRLQATEARERNYQQRSESNTQTLTRDKKCLEDKSKDLCGRVRRLESELQTEEVQKEQARVHFQDLVRRLCLCLAIDVCDSSHLTPDTVLVKAGEIVAELQRLRTKMGATCETLNSCEAELLNVKSLACAEKQRMQSQIESLQSLAQDLENRSRQAEKNVQMTRDRLAECEVNGEKLREELRGFESRCCRLQNNIDRFQSDRLTFMRGIASTIGVPEPCETLIKDKVREITHENQAIQTQLLHLREQLNIEAARHREAHESANCRLRAEEVTRTTVEERFDKSQHELQHMRAEHTNLSEFLVRLARALSWSECAEPPSHGSDTTILCESLLERAERLAVHHEQHIHGLCDKHCWDTNNSNTHQHQHHHHLPKIRRERSCHDIPLKESSAMYSLQRRVRVLREQVQRRDLHLELLRRKLALLEDGARGKSIAQGERDDAIHRARRSAKDADRTAKHLIEAKSQLAEVKSQLAEAADFKITSLERARKIDELQHRICELEADRTRLMGQVANFKTRARSAVEGSNDRKLRDEQMIHNIQTELARVKSSLADANHRLSQVQAFRSSVARILHLRDLPETDILQRLTTLCNAHQEFTLLSRRYESASPVAEHRFDDLIPPPVHRPLSSSPGHQHHHPQHNHNHNHHHHRRYEDSGYTDEHYDDDFEFTKKY